MQHFMTSYLCNFYPRSPCGERRPISANIGIGVSFLSTLSLRRATSAAASWFASRKYFYPRSPCGERLEELEGKNHVANFYPRSPCGERPPPAPQGESSKKFLSTLSLRRATFHGRCARAFPAISIHALLAESDPPLPPDEIRHLSSIHALLAESDRGKPDRICVQTISIHALLAESDKSANAKLLLQLTFLSTLSLRRATSMRIDMDSNFGDFYPRSPCGERLVAGR